MGLEAPRGQLVEAVQFRDGQAPSVPLVRQRGVGIAVAEDNVPAGQRRQELLAHKLRPRSREQQRLRLRRYGGIGELEDAAQSPSQCCAARLRQQRHGVPQAR